jgi:hypothetical protein
MVEILKIKDSLPMNEKETFKPTLNILYLSNYVLDKLTLSED